MVTSKLMDMATRLSNRKEKGYYRRLNGDFAEDDYGETCIGDNDLVIGEEDVYEVERLIEKRVIKVRPSLSLPRWRHVAQECLSYDV